MFDPISCVGMPPFRPIVNKTCIQVTEDMPKDYFQQRDVLKNVLGESKVNIFDTFPMICDSQKCEIRTNKGLMYRTERYLSTEGSKKTFLDFEIK
jgi:hypothetical protein